MGWKRCVILHGMVREGLAGEGDIGRPEGSKGMSHTNN